MTNCAKLVKTTPAKGAIVRNPPDHQCGRLAAKGSIYCGQHDPATIKAYADLVDLEKARQQEYMDSLASTAYSAEEKTLCDSFALQAMIALITEKNNNRDMSVEGIADACYRLAEAMIKRRSK